MKKISIIPILIFLTILSSCENDKKEKKSVNVYKDAEVAKVDPVKRGEMLVNGIGCHDCHTPKKMTAQGPILDMEKLLSGHPQSEILPPYDSQTGKNYVLFNQNLTAAIGPWGTSFAANLTPSESGIGSWTEAQFLNAIKNGKSKGLDGSRTLLPPMPWQAFAQLPDEDLKAIFAYLKSIKPVENIVPNPTPSMGS
ncbi:Cytochrome c [Flavobacteriaceae bacterium MAR_2010_188]|nr:Cytochrome c [Flavobacteriaceae bacterium MAR_2010_188]